METPLIADRSPVLLGIEFCEDPPWLTLRLRGELDIVSAPAVQLPAEALRGAVTVVADLSGLAFCDSFGLHAIDQLCRDQVAAGREVRIVGASAYLQKLARLAGVLPQCLTR